MDQFDLEVQVNSDPKKGKPPRHDGRPWKVDEKQRKRMGNTGGRTRAEVIEILNAHGHNLPV